MSGELHAELARLREELATATAGLARVEQDRNTALERVAAEAAGRAAAEERAQAAGERARVEAERAGRAETTTVDVRTQLDAPPAGSSTGSGSRWPR